MAAIRTEIRRLTRQGAARLSCQVKVESVIMVSPGFVRVALQGPGLAAYREVHPADAFKIMLPPTGHPSADLPAQDGNGVPHWPEGARQPVARAFTVRYFYPEASRLEFDAMLHDTGLVRNWLDYVQPGDVIGIVGMRHEFHAGEGVTRHLIVGDSSALPAVAAIIESLEPGVPATVYLAIDHDADKALVPTRRDVKIYWVAGGSPTGPDSPLERAVRRRERRGGRIQAWLAAEAGVVRGLRRWVLEELGVALDDLHAAAYWKAELSSTQRDALELERYERELASGADPNDPTLRERVELGV